MARNIEKDPLQSNGEWLVDIIKEQNQPEASSKPALGKVPRTFREIKSYENCFDPMVVSLGPYHYHDERLKPMESYKKEAAKWYMESLGVSVPEVIGKVYNDFVTKATHNNKNLKDWYVADESMDIFKDEEKFNRMMFLDGCFILYFVTNFFTKNITNCLDDELILQDMFLLENQIPFVVLKALMDLMLADVKKSSNNNIEKLINFMVLDKYESTSSSCFETNSNANGPLHLLDFLRIKLIGHHPVNHINDEDTNDGHNQNYYVRSIRELKASGIKLRKTDSRKLTEIKFKKGCIFGTLYLPQMTVEDRTKTRLLNLIAYEMCSEPPSDSHAIVTSYICFLDSLIDHADDVKELRSEGILLNCLGSDEEVAKLFNEVATNLVPNNIVYANTKKGIQLHCTSRYKVWFAEMLYTHFSSPWTVISLIAVVLLLLLTVLQTIFAVWSWRLSLNSSKIIPLVGLI